MKTCTHTLLAVIALTLAAGAAVAWDTEAAAGIDAAQERMREGLQASDAEALADIYADGFRLFSPFKPVCDSRAELIKQFRYGIDFGLYDFELTRDELLGQGDQVVEIGRIVIYNRAGDQMSSLRFMTLWKKDGDRWRILRDMSTS